MPEFTVTITQAIFTSGSVLIEAATPEEARAIAQAAIDATSAANSSPNAEQSALLEDVGAEMASYLADCGQEDIDARTWEVEEEVLDGDGGGLDV